MHNYEVGQVCLFMKTNEYTQAKKFARQELKRFGKCIDQWSRITSANYLWLVDFSKWMRWPTDKNNLAHSLMKKVLGARYFIFNVLAGRHVTRPSTWSTIDLNMLQNADTMPCYLIR